ncbi:MAG: chromate transporter, partial [Burkholderiales bacterium]|nr:chromate transporter [Burkholderiales bacterium]
KTRFLAGIAILALAGITICQIPFPAIILIAASMGILGRRYCEPRAEALMNNRGNTPQPDAPYAIKQTALIDDNTPTPAHAIFCWRGAIRVLAGGLLAIGLVVAIIVQRWGWHNSFIDMAWFFTKTALLCFGGAYAVLPYVYQAAVGHFHWLSASQMMDGLALGETTPGPLIMIVAFVGFLGGWNKAVTGIDHPLLSALIGTCVACFFTFLPSFLFILLGAPLVESTRNNMRLAAPLRAISAAVVGVIFSLAFFFARQVFVENSRSVNWTAISITLFASVVLLRYKLGTIPLLVGCALLGWLAHAHY